MSSEHPGDGGPFEHIGPAIRILRAKAGFTQLDLADRARLTKSQVSRYERGTQRPSLETVDRILVAVAADDLDLSAALAEAALHAAHQAAVESGDEAAEVRARRRRMRRTIALLVERYLADIADPAGEDGKDRER